MARTVKLEFNKRRLAGFTGNQLKLIACILMLCDHIGAMAIENGALYGQNPAYWLQAIQSVQGHRLYIIARILRYIGRLAFPIFAFLLAEGFYNTKSEWKYCLRLFITALLSELPFDLGRKGLGYLPEYTEPLPFLKETVLNYADYQNILFTFLLAGIALTLIRRMRKYSAFLAVPVLFLCCCAAEFLHTDYGAMGVLLPCAFFILRNEKTSQLIVAALLSAGESLPYYGVSALSCVLLYFYNGNRGSWRLKYLFYIFYPLHMALICLMVTLANR